MVRKNNIVWSFVDLFLLLSVAFLLATQVEKKESSASERYAPKIYLFLEQAENPQIKCNGRYIHNGQLSQIVRTALKKDVHHVEVIAMVDASVPYGFVDNVKRAALSARTVKKQEGNHLRVVWDTRILSNYSTQ